MPLRWKTLSVVSAAIVVMVLALVAASQTIFMRGFQRLENQEAARRVDSLSSALQDRVKNLTTLNHDWAAWDDTYNFVQHPETNQAYVESNPTDTTFANARLNLISIVDTSGHVVYAKAFDLEKGQETPVPAEWSAVLYTDHQLTHDEPTDSDSGIVILPEGPMIISCLPIITSQGEGPVAGTIIMGQLIDSEMTESITETVQLPFTLWSLDAVALPREISAAIPSLTGAASSVVRPVDSRSMAGFTLVKDINGDPSFVLSTTLPRDIYAHAVEQRNLFFFALLGMAIIVGLILYRAQGWLVLSKLKRIASFANGIRSSGRLDETLQIEGRDELSQLAADINSMVETLREAQRALRERQQGEEKLRLTIESVVEGIVTTDAEGKIVDLNDSKMTLHGYTSKADLLGKNFTDLIAEEDRTRAADALRRTAEDGGKSSARYSMLRRNGSRFVGERAAAVLRDAQGKLTGFVISTRDVTDQDVAEQTREALNRGLKELNEKLESRVEERTRQLEEAVVAADASNRAKSEFLASMSHELRTPLNAIIGFSQMLDAKYFGDLNEKQSEYVDDILSSGKHLLSLINDILDLSKIEAGKMELEVGKLRVLDLVKGSLVMVKEKASDHGITLEVEAGDDVEGLEIPGDERRLKQVMFNLLSNAAKFTPDGGRIAVELHRGGDQVTISVSDTGIGISSEEQQKLFQAFYQASGGLKDKTPGTGLGLAITKSIVEKHGGTIWVESDGRGKGSRFTFALPLASKPPESVTLASPSILAA